MSVSTQHSTQPTSTHELVLDVSNLEITLDDAPTRALVRDVSFQLHRGMTTAIVGESGSGKTICARALLDLNQSPIRTTNGSVFFEGQDLLDGPRREWHALRGRAISMIFQEPMSALNPVVTVGEQIIETIRRHRTISRKTARAEAIRALDEVGLPKPDARLGSYPHELSGGMRQRVMIAIALVCEPSVLVADEPTTALDVTIQARILDLLARLRASRGLAVLLITHDLGLVRQYADHVVVMHRGHIVERASVDDLFRHPTHPYTIGLLGASPRLDERRDRLESVVAPDPGTVPITAADGMPAAWWPSESENPGRMLELRPGHAWRVMDAAPTMHACH